MYRCTECHSEYEECPKYCECGNDEFEEVMQEQSEEETADEEESVKVVKKKSKKKLTAEEKAELEELEEEQRDKIKSYIAMGVSLVLCIVVFILPPHKKTKMEHVKEKVAKEKVALPSVSTYWDDTLPSAFKKDDPLASLPLLNKNFGHISLDLRNYLVKIGSEFNKKWDTSMVKGSGSCTAQFILNKEGTLTTKNIISNSENQNLNDSVSLLLTKISGFDMPPDDYRGEKIYIQFSIDENGVTKVTYPSK